MLIPGLRLHHIAYRIYKALLYGIGQEHQQSVNHQWLYAGLKTKYHSNRSLLEFTAAVTNITRYHTHPFNGPLSRTARVNRYEKDKTNEWQWVAVASAGPYASLHLASGRYPLQHTTPQFLQAGCLSCRPTNRVKARYYCENLSLLLCYDFWS